MKAKTILELFPGLWVEDAAYYEKQFESDIAWQIQSATIDGSLLWFQCCRHGCDNRPFSMTLEQFNDAKEVINCEYCDTECAPTNKPGWAE